MYFTSGSDRAFEQLMQGKPGFDHYDSGEAVTPEDCGTCRFYRPHWKYQFCIYAECPYQPGKLTAYDAVTFRVKGVENMAVFRVERNKGYTVMSNHHLRNKDLSLKAKGLLSQMLSLPEDWDYTLKGLSLINREQIDAIRAAIRELEQAGYIVRSRERDSQGRLRGADYVIYEQPQPVPDSPTLENPMLDNPTQEKPTLGKPTQLNKDISSKEKSITDVSITDPIPILSRPSPLEDEAAQPPERKGTEAKSQSAIEIYRQIIMDNIEYEHLCQHVKGIDRETLDEIVDLLVETVCSARKTIRIAGDDYPAELVKSKFMKLDSSHIEFVFDCLSKNTSEIRNIKKYLLAILAVIMCYELIDMIVEKNNMHDFDTSMFFRWIFKSAFAILIVTNTWNIVMGVFDATQAVVNQSAGVIIGETSIDFDTLIPDLEAQLEAMDIGPLLGLWFQTLVVGLTMNILSICFFLVTYGRMIEIYAVTALGPIPLATLGNAEWRGVGQNYLKSLLALGFQAFLIMVVVGIYAVLIQQIGQAADISGAIWGCMGYTVLLCFCLFKTGSISKAVFTAH